MTENMMLPFPADGLIPLDANETVDEQIDRSLQAALKQTQREIAICTANRGHYTSCADNVRYFAPRWMRATDPLTGVADYYHLLTFVGDAAPGCTQPMAVRASDGRVGWLMNRRLEVLHGLPPLLARWVDDRWEFAVDWSQDPMFDLEVNTVCGREYRRVSIECARDGCDDRMIELCLWSLLKAEQENWRWLGGAAPGALVNGAAPGVPGQVPAQQAPACRLLGY